MVVPVRLETSWNRFLLSPLQSCTFSSILIFLASLCSLLYLDHSILEAFQFLVCNVSRFFSLLLTTLLCYLISSLYHIYLLWTMIVLVTSGACFSSADFILASISDTKSSKELYSMLSRCKSSIRISQLILLIFL